MARQKKIKKIIHAGLPKGHGDRYHKMDVTLEKLGYYNPNASEDYDFIGKRLKLSKKIIKS